MTPAEIRALRDAATQGPWEIHDSVTNRDCLEVGTEGWDEDSAVFNGYSIALLWDGYSGQAANAALIAAAPTLATIAADALDEVARLREALEQVNDKALMNAGEFAKYVRDTARAALVTP